MSQGHPAYPQQRNAFATSSKLPDRTYTTAPVDNTSQQKFARSAYSRRPDQTHPARGQAQYAPQYGQQQQPVGQTRHNMEKEAENNVAILTDDQRDEITEAFTLFDIDNDEHLTFQETRVAFRALGFKIPRQELRQILEMHGVPSPIAVARHRDRGAEPERYHVSNLVLAKNAFMRLAADKVINRDPHDEVERAFNLFDQDKKGYIVFEDLRRVAHELGETGLEDEELHAMINEFDFDGSGTVARETFYSILMN